MPFLEVGKVFQFGKKHMLIGFIFLAHFIGFFFVSKQIMYFLSLNMVKISIDYHWLVVTTFIKLFRPDGTFSNQAGTILGCGRNLPTPPRTPRISRLKSLILKPRFLS